MNVNMAAPDEVTARGEERFPCFLCLKDGKHGTGEWTEAITGAGTGVGAGVMAELIAGVVTGVVTGVGIGVMTGAMTGAALPPARVSFPASHE